MKVLTFSLIVTAIIFTLGCSTENPLCTDNYCVEGEVFLKTDLEEDETFDELPGTVSEQSLIDLLTVDVGEYTFESVEVTGNIDWDFQDTDWQYRENSVTYLKKVTLEIEADEGRFGENRVLLIHLNKDTISRDAKLHRTR